MKKLWIVLLSLAMVAAFCMPASAVDVKFSGSFYVAGDYYSDKLILDEDDQSTAFIRQRLRLQTEFVVSPGLSLITRFDALEKQWGDSAWTGSQTDVASRPAVGPKNFRMDWEDKTKVQENIEFEQAYIQYMSKIGLWWVGYAPHDFWGTTFGDSTHSKALVQWILPINENWVIGAKYFKSFEGSSTYKDSTNRGVINANDADDDAYVFVGMYKNQAIETGLKVAYRRVADNRDDTPFGLNSALPPNQKMDGWLLTPYFKGQWGPVKVQAELEYWNGEVEAEDGYALPDGRDSWDMEFLAAYLNAEVAFGPAYVGANFIYASGAGMDDVADGDLKGSNFSYAFQGCWGGKDLKQTLILWNQDVTDWAGDFTGLGPAVMNAFFYQIYGGYKWGDFDFKASLAYAEVDEEFSLVDGRPYYGEDDEIGTELDVTATYSITNNLKYMVGFGYLWTGDYFAEKGYDDDVDDIYLLTNKLTLTF
ncbi:MAG: hypothetical protein JW902_07160 [Syntrophaceae bacterium]|nr:hypothetical protein [Syntrophaceae bacterium]